MFCPKCGKELPDSSAFCSGCGAKLDAKAASAKPEAKPANTSSTTGTDSGVASVLNKIPAVKKYGSNPILIIFEVCAVIALLCSIFPWFEVNSSVAATSSGVSGVASFFGASQGAFVFETEYNVWALPALADTVSDYLSFYGALGAGSKASSSAGMIVALAWVCLLLWIASWVLLIVGDITARKTQNAKLMDSGCGCLCFCAIAFMFMAGQIGESVGTATIAPMACAFFSIAAGIGYKVLTKKAKTETK